MIFKRYSEISENFTNTLNFFGFLENPINRKNERKKNKKK